MRHVYYGGSIKGRYSYFRYISFTAHLILQIKERDVLLQQTQSESEQRASTIDQLKQELDASQSISSGLQQQLRDAQQLSSQQMKECNLRIDHLTRELMSANVCALLQRESCSGIARTGKAAFV